MRISSIIITLVLLLSFFVVVPVSAATPEVWVDDDGPDNGVDHFDTIQEGIDAVDAGGTVYVAAGTYNEYISIRYKNLSLIGAGPAVTTINAGSANNAIWAQGLDNSTLVEGFTVTNGHGTQGGGMVNASSNAVINNCVFTNNYGGEGGGMFIASCSPTITNCTFSENRAATGGGLNTYNASPNISDCTFVQNTATNRGGGLYLYISDLFGFSNCTISNNTANAGGGGIDSHYTYLQAIDCTISDNDAAEGAGIFNWNSSADITNTVLSNNISSGRGGAFFNLGSTYVTVDSCTIFANIAHSGAGMYNSVCSPTIRDSLFLNNTTIAYGYGGGMYNNLSSPTVKSCIFDSNSADWGGAFYNVGSDNSSISYITNCIITSNFAPWGGGGMFNADGSLIAVTNCTFSANTVQYQGACAIQNDYGCQMTVTNSIFWENGSLEIDFMDNQPTINYCDIKGQGWYPGTGNFDLNPMFVNAASGDYSLSTGSPCIDTGTDTSGSSYGSVIDDIDKTSRPQGGVYDIGAYEYDPPVSVSITSSTANCDGTIDVTAQMTGGTPPYTYLWDIDGDGFDDGTGASTTLNVGYDYTGTISVQATDDDSNTATDDDSSARTYPELTVSITVFDVDNSTGTVAVTAVASGGSGCYTYLWDIDGDGFDDGAGASTVLNPGMGSSGTATVRVTDSEGCMAEDSGEYFIKSSWSVSVVRPLVQTNLSKANSMWACLMEELPTEVSEDVEALLDDVQEHMENASVLSNPIYANGELIKAMALMKQINDEFDCGCYPE